jgi:hypothetical protein
MTISKILGVGWTKDSGLSCPDVKVNRPEPTDLSIFIAQKNELYKEKMDSWFVPALRGYYTKTSMF